MGENSYNSVRERLKAEYKIFLLAFLFILIADTIGQIKIPFGPGTVYPVSDFLRNYSWRIKRTASTETCKPKRGKGSFQISNCGNLSVHR